MSIKRNNISDGFSAFLKKLFPPETRLGMLISLIIGFVGCIVAVALPSQLPWSILIQTMVTILITAILANAITRYQSETIDSATNKALKIIDEQYIRSATKIAVGAIEEKFISVSGKSNNLFQIFHLNNGGNFNIAHNKFFSLLIESYSNNGEKRKYFISIDTYYKLVVEFLNLGYKLKTINGLLLPFWYAPKEKDESLEDYIDYCKENAQLYKRITYYQDYDGNNDWRDDTVRMIYKDLKSSEKSDDVAVRWIITLIKNVTTLKNLFGNEIIEFLGIDELRSINYFNYNEKKFIEAIKKNISNFENDFLKKKYGDTTISRKMTDIINKLFEDEMKENNFVGKSIIDNTFHKDEIDFEVVTEVGYYYKEKDAKECDQFVMYLNGSNAGPSVEIQIITEVDKGELIATIQRKLSDLFRENENGLEKPRGAK
jgi:uncharacterized membrane protein YeaQ/YmgE (transglycosylase-associated protein family)